MPNDIGLIGLAVMGKNLALNIERHGFKIAVFNRSPKPTDDLLAHEAKGKNLTGFKDLRAFVSSLTRPRKIIIMIKAGAAVDESLAALKPLLEKGDIVIDAGNSFYKDTERRIEELATSGIRYVGMGVSGGEEGALWGPSIMPGGDSDSFTALLPILDKIAAGSDSGPCVSYIGEGGAGHFVKMVHNGIEYGDMQLIAETYDLMRHGLGLNPAEMAAIFRRWNQGLLKSYLIEITAKVLEYKESQGSPFLVDQILDKAGQKGTGAWTIQAALEEGVAVPTITAAVDARNLSALKTERVHAASVYQRKTISKAPIADWADKLMAALYASKICSYAQGFALLSAADKNHVYGLRLDEIARIWKGGCIIRAVFLDEIRKTYSENPRLTNLLLAPELKKNIESSLAAWQDVLTFAIQRGIPVPAMSASFAYFTSYTSALSPANLIQAQRDYFGAHTYERINKPGIFHTQWEPKRD